MRDVVIVGAARTPIGSFLGELSAVAAPQLGAVAIAAALERAGLPVASVDEVFMGCVLPAGLGQAPARQAALAARLPQSVRATTVNKVCGSGLQAVLLGASMIRQGEADVVVAGGMESMSNAPYLVGKAREGLKMGHGRLVDSMLHDGLWDAYGDTHMGNCAELCAREHAISRAQQDEHAAESYRRAQAAQAAGSFREELVAVEVAQRKGPPRRIEQDEEPQRGDVAKLAALRPVFDPGGTITAGNASSLNDGAAAVVLASREVAERRGLDVMARLGASASYAHAPDWFTTAPASAIGRALDRAGLTKDDIDLYEINEAFSVVSLVNNRLLGLDAARVNVHGGAVALGHPLGASGARLLVTLSYELRRRAVRRGVVSLCIGGGEGIAAIVERP
jgi:acetyl-CoA C-acetyltransferase